ncbi:MAG: translation elongation factor Ts [Planctomycetes bacterium]|nr:translation elongation factor Ts [Planctomycetota bacterium]
MSVEPEKVKELREMTGLPMMECKRALEKSGGDTQKAFEELRKAGLKAQEKLAGRAANEGRIGSWISPDGKAAVLVALRCETEPVGKNELFLAFLKDLVGAIAAQDPKDPAALNALKLPSGATVEAALTDLVSRIRENISVGRFCRVQGDAVVPYVHFDQKKAALVALKGGSVTNPKVAEAGKELAMQVVFSPPASLDRHGLDAALVAKEQEIILAQVKNDPRNAKKPEEILKKIVEGQLNQFYASKCLLEQPYIREPKQTVTQYLTSSGTGVAVERFAYVATDLS